jgi:hypothetical protein
MKFRLKHVIWAVFIYLYIPFALFAVGFLRIGVGIPAALLVGWILLRYLLSPKSDEVIEFSARDGIVALVIILGWVLLSGLGGYAFQNSDHNIRNSIFHDLVNFSWPVRYNGTVTDAGLATASSDYSMVYYIGFWLPAAAVGKLLGWKAAELALYLWTALGVGLTLLLLKQYIRTSLVRVILMLVFFSGMDAFGVLIETLLVKNGYPYFWPPIAHLEWWGRRYQFSSFTTQLFWVFNQAVPAWICVALHLAQPDRKRTLLLWSFCFFFAPIPSIGLFPFALFEIPEKTFLPRQLGLNGPRPAVKTILGNIWSDLRSVFTLENVVAGGTIFFITAAYFLSNHTSGKQGTGSVMSISPVFYLMFILVEGLLLWLILWRANRRNLEWYLVAVFLVAAPLITIGYSNDFCMRASIPALFILMAGSLKGLLDRKIRYRFFLILMLAVGAITPIYEMNRSVYRTWQYLSNEKYYQSQPKINPVDAVLITCIPEKDHPNDMLADEFGSLSNLPYQDVQNFVAKIDGTLYGSYLIQPR